MAKVYEITVTYKLRKVLVIEADSYDEAVDQAWEADLPGVTSTKQDGAELVDDSFEIDPDTNKEPVQIVR